VFRDFLNAVRLGYGGSSVTEVAEMRSREPLIVLSLIGLAPAVAGLIFDVEGFLAHVLAGVSSLILGAVLAVVLIDQLLQQRRREQWQTVRDAIRRAICEGVVDMATSFALVVADGEQFLGLVGPEDDPLPRPQIAAALRKLVVDSEANREYLAKELEPDTASSRALYEQVAPTIAQFGATMTTRVIALGDEPQLVESLLALERAEHQWKSWVETVEGWGAPDAYAWQQATNTLRAAGNLYSYFVMHT
jgi:hypothetical protein